EVGGSWAELPDELGGGSDVGKQKGDGAARQLVHVDQACLRSPKSGNPRWPESRSKARFRGSSGRDRYDCARRDAEDVARLQLRQACPEGPFAVVFSWRLGPGPQGEALDAESSTPSRPL